MKPYDVYRKVQEALGYPLPKSQQGMNLGMIKRLTIKGYPPQDIIGCARFLASDPFFSKRAIRIDLRHITKRIAPWVKTGRPRYHPDSPEGKAREREPERPRYKYRPPDFSQGRLIGSEEDRR